MQIRTHTIASLQTKIQSTISNNREKVARILHQFPEYLSFVHLVGEP